MPRVLTQPTGKTSAAPPQRSGRPVYLDCAATTPVDPRVQEAVVHYLSSEFGNAGSKTHGYGAAARQAVEWARDQVARVVEAGRGDVIFTSGATESNNLALIGLARHGKAAGKRHIVSTRIEHRAVLEPLQALEQQGFAVRRSKRLVWQSECCLKSPLALKRTRKYRLPNYERGSGKLSNVGLNGSPVPRRGVPRFGLRLSAFISPNFGIGKACIRSFSGFMVCCAQPACLLLIGLR